MNENPPWKSMSDTKLKMKKIGEHQVGKTQNKQTLQRSIVHSDCRNSKIKKKSLEKPKGKKTSHLLRSKDNNYIQFLLRNSASKKSKVKHSKF